MSSLFDDEVVNLVFRFQNPNRKDMENADKTAGRLAMSLDQIVRKAVSAGKSIGEVADSMKLLEPTLKKMEQKAGSLGQSVFVYRQLAKFLSHYTTDRLELIQKQTLLNRKETSGSASLHKALEQNTQALNQLVSAQRLNRVSGNNKQGYGLYLDTETTGLNPLKHQITELGAVLFKYDKTTGKVIQVMERVYSGLQDLETAYRKPRYVPDAQIARLPSEIARAITDRAKRIENEKQLPSSIANRMGGQFQPGYLLPGTLLPSGVSPRKLRGQSISRTNFLNLLNKADFVVAHNVTHDKKFLERVIPEVGRVPWMDSMRHVDWRGLGFSSRALQSLLRAHDIPAGRAHRALDDSIGGVNLLNKPVIPGNTSGPTYLSHMIGELETPTRKRQSIQLWRQQAEEMLNAQMMMLGESGRYRWPHATATMRRDQGNRYVVESIEGGLTAKARRPAHNTEWGYKKGSIGSADPTPQNVGAAAFEIDKNIETLQRFIRLLSTAAPTNYLAAGLYDTHVKQLAFQEKQLQRYGEVRRPGDRPRLGEDMTLAAMRGTYSAYQSGLPYTGPIQYQKPEEKQIPARVEMMLNQLWAKANQKPFKDSEIDFFLRSFTGENADLGTHAFLTSTATYKIPGIAAQMANQLGKDHPLFDTLTSMMLTSQKVNRENKQIRSQRIEEERLEQAARSIGLGGGGGGARRRPSIVSNALGMLKDAGIATGLSMVMPVVGLGGFGAGSFSSIFKKLRAQRASAEQGPEEDNVRQAAKPTVEPPLAEASLKAQMRFDALNAKLASLTDSIQGTTRAFEQFRDVAAPARRKLAQDRFADSNQRADDTKADRLSALDRQSAILSGRKEKIGQTAQRRLTDLQNSFDSRVSSSGMSKIWADLAVEDAKNRFDFRVKQLSANPLYQKKSKEELEAMARPPLAKAQMRQILAQYEHQSLKIDTSKPGAEQELDDLRKATAAKFAAARYGTVSSKGIVEKKATLANEVYENLSGRKTPEQLNRLAADRVGEDALAAAGETTAKVEEVEGKKERVRERARKQREKNERTLADSLGKIEEDVNKKSQDLGAKKAANERKQNEAKTAYIKRELDIAGGGGGGGRGRNGGGGGGGSEEDDFMSRTGFGWGLGMASVIGYNSALKELIKDATIYAARTQTMQLVTEQMAKVNGLNTDQVEAQVDKVKELNITTQEAHGTVQKMMFAQLDVAKATNLARVAQDAAILANVNSSEALDKIILGIVTGQTRLLHNMGLQVSMLQVLRELRMKKRADGDKSEPNELEKRQEMLNKVLLEGARIAGSYEKAMLTVGKQFNSLQREVQETQNAIGQEFLPEFGRFVSLTSQGLKVMRENSGATAQFATGLVSLGTAAGAMSSIAFIRWMMTNPAIPWWAKGIGAVVGTATYLTLNQDTPAALTQTATEVNQNTQDKINKLREERKRLWNDRDESSEEWKNSWKLNTVSLQSLTNGQVEIERELTKQLAEEYNKRLKDFDQYTQQASGKRGLFARAYANLRIRFDMDLLRRAVGKDDVPSAPGLGISEEDVKKEAALQRLKESNPALLGPSLTNKQQAAARMFAARVQQAEAALFSFEEKHGELGATTLRQRKSMGSPREKLTLEYENDVAKLNLMRKEMLDLDEKVKRPNPKPEDLLQYEKNMKAIGGDSITAGEEKKKLIQEKFEIAIAETTERFQENASKITRHTQAAIIQNRVSTAVAGAQGRVISGDPTSEVAGIEAAFAIKKKAIREELKLLGDVDEFKKKNSQNEQERLIGYIKLNQQKHEADREYNLAVSRGQATFDINRIAESPIDERLASLQIYMREYTEAQKILDLNKRRNEQLAIELKYNEAIEQATRRRRMAKAELDIATREANLELISEVDRVVTSPGRSSQQRALDEIERTRRRTEDAARYRYDRLQPETPAEGQEGLRNQRDLTINQANTAATLATIKELDAQVEAARTRLADSYDKQFNKMERINELMATNAADEAAAALNTHSLRLEYIEKEYQARGATLDAERDRSRAIQEADFDHLQKLLALKKREIDGIKDAAGRVYDAMLTRGGGSMSDLITGQLRATGRQVFQNVSAEMFGSVRQRLGTVIPGQETVDSQGRRKATMIGRLLSGTMFSPSHTEEINSLLAKVTAENTQATKELTAAIANRDAAIVNLPGGSVSSGEYSGQTGSGGLSGLLRTASAISGVSGPTGKTAGILQALGLPGGSIASSTGIFGGSSQGNPLIFHSASSGSAKQASTSDIDRLFGIPAKPSKTDMFTNSLVLGAAGKYNAFDVLSGASSVRTGEGSATGLTKSQRVGAVAGIAATVGMGAMTAVSGFKEGGARGITKGIGGLLTAASAIPGPQQPFVMAGAMLAGVMSSMFGEKKEKRKNDIEDWMRTAAYIPPISINIETDASGNLISYNKFGKARSISRSAFPVRVQQTVNRQSITDEDQWLEIPGQVLSNAIGPAPVVPGPSSLSNPAPIISGGNRTLVMQIQAMDSQSIINRSRDIAAAVSKELGNGRGGDLSYKIQQTVFGA